MATREDRRRVFQDAKEAAFIAFKDLQELDQHPEVRRALLAAMLKDGIDSGPRISIEEFREQHRATLREYANSEPPHRTDDVRPDPPVPQ